MNVLLSGLSSDRVEINLAQALKLNGVDLHVIADPNTPAVTMCREAGIPVTSHFFRHRLDRQAITLYRDLCAGRKFDILHCLTNRAVSTGLWAMRQHARGPRIVAYRGTMGHLSRFDPASHLSYLNRRIDSIVCVSDAVKKYLKTFSIPDEKLEVIWKGHDTSWYTASARSALLEFGIPVDSLVVNFTGNIRPVKGVHYLLKAFESISPVAGIHLLVVGEVRDPDIRKKIGKHPHIHFAGFRKDATSLAGACDIAVMPSIEREGLPKSILEAMAQGVPSVVTQVGGLPELVEDGKCGLVVPPKNSTAIADAIMKLAGDRELLMQMRESARARVAGPFNFRHTVEKTLALYRRLLGS
ncbi:MAG TPA: glycosyltransferase family 4 protein [Kiritimatiellia bacterium]|nr:glycosyltransferase family 4 protein [Kiritimatiellia bacterium]